MLSIVILTKNEKKDLPDCLSSIDWCDDIHIVDSGSTDDTIKIASLAKANVYVYPFESFGEQRNWLLDHCSSNTNGSSFWTQMNVLLPIFAKPY